MNKADGLTRRGFVKHSVLGVGALGPTAAAANSSAPVRRKSKIGIGARISPAWLKSPNDNDLRFLKQIGVDYVCVTLDMVQGYRETGCFTGKALQELLARLAAVGLRVQRANSLAEYYRNAHLGRPGGQREIDNLKNIARLLVRAEIPVFGIQACQATLHIKGARGWSRREGRGGYRYPAFDLEQSRKLSARPEYQVTADQLWKGLLNIYRQVLPIVDGSRTRIAMHGNDPPLPEYLGNPQILCRFADFDRLFKEVPGRNNAMTFCVGTRYESGENVFEGIRRFGKQGKICHVHFRNVRGTLAANRGYAEVFVDDGDLDMARVLRALDEVGYDGVIDYDHAMNIQGDEPLSKQYIAFATGYMKGLRDSL